MNNLNNPISNTPPTETTKKVYSTPTVIELGNINDLVKANSLRLNPDGTKPLNFDDNSVIS